MDLGFGNVDHVFSLILCNSALLEDKKASMSSFVFFSMGELFGLDTSALFLIGELLGLGTSQDSSSNLF